MCTVTYIPGKGNCFITSSRDEKAVRPNAVPPALYNLGESVLLYPKDAAAEGTWIASSKNGNAAVLLNGAFVKHLSNAPYRKSRGLIFNDIISHQNPVNFFCLVDLYKIEPFTIIILQQGKLFECRWDGQGRHCHPLNHHLPHIWSSVTLYTPEVIEKRMRWFNEWIKINSGPSQNDIFSFHRFAGDGDRYNDVLMNRDGEMLTVSITGMNITAEKTFMNYIDLKTGTTYAEEQEFESSLIALA